MNAQIPTPPAVGTVMHSPVVSVADDDSLWTAMDLMLTRGLRHLVVVHGQTTVGVLADRELATAWALNPLGLKHRVTAEVLAPVQMLLTPDVDVVTVAQRMRRLGADALVVVDDEQRPVGIVTDHDLLGVLAGLLGADDAEGSEAVRYHGAGHPVLQPD